VAISVPPEASGKLPPQNEEAETSVLGAILLSEQAFDGLMIDVRLTPGDFYRPRHRHIWEAMIRLKEKADPEPIDALTVTEELSRAGVLEEAGGSPYIHSLANSVPSAGNVRHYGRIVKNHSLMRRLLDTTRSIQDDVFTFTGPAKELLEQAESELFKIAHDDRTGELRAIEDVLHDELDKLEKISREGIAMTGTPSGFIDLDEMTGGFQPGNLIVMAARPSMGKSAWVINVAEHAAVKYGKPVALFSLEMSETELAQRFIACQASLNGDDLRKGRIRPDRWPKVVRATEKLASSPLFIDDSSDVGILDLRAKARRLHARQELGLVIVDYLQLMRAENSSDSRVEQVGQISRGLKMLARELKVPVIAVSQLSRAVESRNPPKPMLSDLRESGQIEQDADVVMFIYRDEYYNRDSERPGEADIIVAKHRNGPVGDVVLSFLSRYPKFANLARDHGFGVPGQDRALPGEAATALNPGSAFQADGPPTESSTAVAEDI
jgi:replicative DNA helicase